jgi:hypothetical protein
MLITIIFTGIFGYIFGAAKVFRDQKLKAYEEILPPIVKAAFNPKQSDEPDFNKAMVKLWLFASRKVALKMDTALSFYIDPKRGDKTEALQQAIAEMRADIQFIRWRRKKVKPEEVKHFYMYLGRQQDIVNMRE